MVQLGHPPAFPGYLVGVDQAGHDVDGDGEDDRAVVFS